MRRKDRIDGSSYQSGSCSADQGSGASHGGGSFNIFCDLGGRSCIKGIDLCEKGGKVKEKGNFKNPRSKVNAHQMKDEVDCEGSHGLSSTMSKKNLVNCNSHSRCGANVGCSN